MSEAITISDATVDEVLSADKPVLILFSDGDGLRSDFTTAYKKAIAEETGVTFARINPSQNPQTASRFNVGSKPVLVGWFKGEEVVRRNRPWGTDVPMIVEKLKAAYTEHAPQASDDSHSKEQTNEQTQEKDQNIVDTKPVNVTDDTFQTEVIDHDLPVVIDFWAEWCGPCRMVAPILEKLAGEFAGKVRIAKVDVDANPGLSQTFKIMSIPTIMMIKNRTIVFQQPGALPEEAMRDLFQQLVDLEVPDPETQTEETAE